MTDVNVIDSIRRKIYDLHKSKETIHINVSISRPRVNLENREVQIVGVYPHIFQIREIGAENHRVYTVQYVDVITKQVEILELEI